VVNAKGTLQKYKAQIASMCRRVVREA